MGWSQTEPKGNCLSGRVPNFEKKHPRDPGLAMVESQELTKKCRSAAKDVLQPTEASVLKFSDRCLDSDALQRRMAGLQQVPNARCIGR